MKKLQAIAGYRNKTLALVVSYEDDCKKYAKERIEKDAVNKMVMKVWSEMEPSEKNEWIEKENTILSTQCKSCGSREPKKDVNRAMPFTYGGLFGITTEAELVRYYQCSCGYLGEYHSREMTDRELEYYENYPPEVLRERIKMYINIEYK